MKNFGKKRRNLWEFPKVIFNFVVLKNIKLKLNKKILLK
jgi:hypothetical protein